MTICDWCSPEWEQHCGDKCYLKKGSAPEAFLGAEPACDSPSSSSEGQESVNPFEEKLRNASFLAFSDITATEQSLHGNSGRVVYLSEAIAITREAQRKLKQLKTQLEAIGFHRYVAKLWVNPQKNEDPRLIYPDESPEGLYPGFIIPEHHLGKTIFMINSEFFWKLLEEASA